jgi:hypothetical protein
MFIGFPPCFEFGEHGMPREFSPSHHIFYAQRMLDVHDALPKYTRHKEDGEMVIDDEPVERKTRGHV